MNTKNGANTLLGIERTRPKAAGACLVALLVVALLPAAAQATTLVEVDLLGRIQATGGGTTQTHGYGAYGFFAGEDFDQWIDHKHTNWDWNTLLMKICDDGSANISGTARRHDDSLWGMNIDLTGIVFKGAVFSGVTMPYATMLDDLDASMEDGAGLEWTSLTLELTAPYATEMPLTGWTGFAMPSMGHINVAELHYDAGMGLTFEAWYQHLAGTAYYQVGDTKANLIMESLPPPIITEVPEPNAALLALLGLSSWIATRRRRVRR